MNEENILEGVIPTGSIDATGEELNIELVRNGRGDIIHGSITAEDYAKVMKRPSVPAGGVLANIKRIAELEKENAELKARVKELEHNYSVLHRVHRMNNEEFDLGVWKPFSTAPKDGTIILAAYWPGSDAKMTTIFWHEYYDWCEYQQKQVYRSAWLYDDYTQDEIREEGWEPEFWTELPQLPTKRKQ